MNVLDIAQRTPEWYTARLGRLTASRASDMLATIKSGESAARRNLRAQLVLERLTGKSQDSGYQSAAMQAGIEREPDALLWYEAVTGQIVRRTGFVTHDTLMAGASLDGHLGEFDGLVEAKSPLAATHLEYLRTGTVPSDYGKQILHQLWITGARWCDFFSYHPEFPERLRCRLLRVIRDDAAVADYDRLARTFLSEVDREVESLMTLTNLTGQLSEVVL